jgi:rod shape-determining protein MreD
VKAAAVLAAIALALALQTTVARFLVGGSAAVDLVLVAVVYVALITGPVGGMLAGTAAGLVQDALSSGIVGIGGLAKSIVGFLAGAFGQQFIVTVLDLQAFPDPWKAVTTQALGNALVGIVAFSIIESLPGMMERRRSRARR